MTHPTTPEAAALAEECKREAAAIRGDFESTARLESLIDRLAALSQQPAKEAPADRVQRALIERAMGHPVVLEIMADCADAIDTENAAMSDAADAPYDGAQWVLAAKNLRERAAAIRAEDPEIWQVLAYAQSKEVPAVWQYDLDEDAAEVLRDTIGQDEPSRVTLSLCDGHSGRGLYVWVTDYPKEGSLLLTASPSQPEQPQAAQGDNGCPASAEYTRGFEAALAMAASARPEQAAGEVPLYIGACITDGRLHATVMRREVNGAVTVLAVADMDAASLHTHDGLALMRAPDTHPTVTDGASEGEQR